MAETKIEQIRAAHLAARPKPAVNPAWANAEHDIGVLLAEVERLRAKLTNCVHALTFAVDGWDEADPMIQKLRATRDGAKSALESQP